MQFNEVIGQSGAKRQMQQLVAEGRVPHAMLFCGSTTGDILTSTSHSRP